LDSFKLIYDVIIKVEAETTQAIKDAVLSKIKRIDNVRSTINYDGIERISTLQNVYYIIKCYTLHKVVDGLNPEKPSNFEDQSFANQVKYHEKELRRIIKGTSASKIFNLSERNRLLGYGVLLRKGRGKYCRWMISERAQGILEE